MLFVGSALAKSIEKKWSACGPPLLINALLTFNNKSLDESAFAALVEEDKKADYEMDAVFLKAVFAEGFKAVLILNRF